MLLSQKCKSFFAHFFPFIFIYIFFITDNMNIIYYGHSYQCLLLFIYFAIYYSILFFFNFLLLHILAYIINIITFIIVFLL